MEYVKELENIILGLVCLIVVLVIIVGRYIISKDKLENEIESQRDWIIELTKGLNIEKNLTTNLSREIYKKNDIISFMSEQNILLENGRGNVNRNIYIESEVLNTNKGCIFTHRFLNSLRTTKGE